MSIVDWIDGQIGDRSPSIRLSSFDFLWRRL